MARVAAEIRSVLGWLLLAAAAIGAGCSAGGEYRCPEPIGLIVRDDCDDFKTRYESLKVSVAAGFYKFRVETSFVDQALRDPSELIQIMSTRMLGLCHDFNACRLTAAEYLRRRDELDRTTTAIVALGDQLASPGLAPEQRKQALDQLLALLAPPQASPAPAIPDPIAPRPDPAPKPELPKRSYLGSQDPWFDSNYRPPVAPPAAEGFPRLMAEWGKQGIDQSCKTEQFPDCYRPRPRVWLWGPHEADDLVELTLDGGQRLRCPLGRSGQDVISLHRCKVPKEIALTAPRYSIGVAYVRASDEKRAELGRIEQPVAVARYGDYGTVGTHFGIDHDPDLSQGWLFFMPEPLGLPAEAERPYLYATLRYRKSPGGSMFPKGNLRCFVDGKPVGPAVGTARGSGETGWFQDTSRYVTVKPGHSRAAKDPLLVWKHYLFALPWVAGHDGKPPLLDAGDQAWPPAAGRWSCKLKVEGEYLRELNFELDDEGRPKPLAGQRGEPGDLVHPWWRIETKVLPNRIEGDWAEGAKQEPGA